MKKIYILIPVIIVAVAFGLYQSLKQPVVEEVISDQTPALPPEEPIKVPIVRYAVPEPVTTQTEAATSTEGRTDAPATPEQEAPLPLPPVGQSDSRVDQTLTSLFGGKNFNDLLIIDSFIQRLVLTIDRLPEKKLPVAHIPFVFPEGNFLASGSEGSLRTNPENYQRYTPYVGLLEQLNPDQVIAEYIRFYPLLQTAYQQLGYPNAYFNDRLVHVIEHLLETPDPIEPIALEQPSVFYTYTDSQLEDLSSGQKILLRMGQEQRLKVLSLLRQYHFRLTNLTP